jgi:hypothetical protein
MREAQVSRSPILESFILGEITFYPPEVSTHFHFCLQSLKSDTLPPPQVLNSGKKTHPLVLGVRMDENQTMCNSRDF